MTLINASDETENFLKEAKKQTLDVIIHDFALMDGKPLPGVIIRSTDNQDVSIVGCRMMDLVIR